MKDLFLNILNMSITSTYIILGIIILRYVLKNIPKKYRLILWGCLGIRLICPFSFESIFSIVPHNPIYIDKKIPTFELGNNETINPIIQNPISQTINPIEMILSILCIIWIIGSFSLIIYTIFEYFKMKKRINESILLTDNIYLSDRINTPFIFGIFKPRIYIPSILDEKEIHYVVAHESIHLKYHHHQIKMFSYLLLILHWFNPIMWFAYSMLCKDLELICDELAIKHFDLNERKEYLTTLVHCSSTKEKILSPMAFAEIGVKERIQTIVRNKKPTRILFALSLVLFIIFSLCLMTNPRFNKNIDNELYAYLTTELLEIDQRYKQRENDFHYVEIEVLGVEEENEIITVYAIEYGASYGYGLEMFKDTGHLIPMVYTIEKKNNQYQLLEIWQPEDGEGYGDSIKDKFPLTLEGKALYPFDYKKEKNGKEKAIEYFEKNELMNLTYIHFNSDGSVKALLELDKENKIFVLKMQNHEYIGEYTYDESSDKLKLLALDGKQYTFEHHGGLLHFIQDLSSSDLLEDYAEFRFVEKK